MASKMERTINAMPMSFEQAINASSAYAKRHILLGNGFSIACRKDIFRYDRLFEQADFSDFSDSIKDVFGSMKTYDFEKVIRLLQDASLIIKHYGVNSDLILRMQSDAQRLKEVLVRTIAESHPKSPIDISDEEYNRCQTFLSNFNNIYTLNYDLLLYWAIMHNRDNNSPIYDDGFRAVRDVNGKVIDADYVAWSSPKSHSQNIWYLHGSLHIFDSPSELKKYTWNNTGVRLLDQIKAALDKDFFPLFVSEGTSEEKLYRIRHSDYLSKAIRSFQEIRHCLFIYGHSLAENDEHILQIIQNGKVQHLYVGIFGDPDSSDNQKVIKRAKMMSTLRRNDKPLIIEFYDSSSARIWSG